MKLNCCWTLFLILFFWTASRRAEPRELANARTNAIDETGGLYRCFGQQGPRHRRVLPNGASTNLVEVYDVASNTWASVATLPIATNHNAAATVGNRIFAFGGTSNRCFSYNPDMNQWTEVASMNFQHGNTPAVAVIDGESMFPAVMVREVVSERLRSTIPRQINGLCWRR